MSCDTLHAIHRLLTFLQIMPAAQAPCNLYCCSPMSTPCLKNKATPLTSHGRQVMRRTLKCEFSIPQNPPISSDCQSLLRQLIHPVSLLSCCLQTPARHIA